MRFRLTLIDDRTGRPVDTRYFGSRRDAARRCADLLPRVALAKGIDVRHLRGDIREIVTGPVAESPVAGALAAS